MGNMSKKKHKVTPTIKESEDLLAWLCGEDVEFPFFKHPYIIKEKVILK